MSKQSHQPESGEGFKYYLLRLYILFYITFHKRLFLKNSSKNETLSVTEMFTVKIEVAPDIMKELFKINN